MMVHQTVLVAGLGLIGGSLAKGIFEGGESHVIGFDLSEPTLDFALENGIIHEKTDHFGEAAVRADFIILAAPITETINLIASLDNLDFRKKVIVSDTASVKNPIIEAAGKLKNKKISFIGGHPMAGSHKKGVQAAKKHLFENAIYVLSPTAGITKEEIESLKRLLSGTNSKFVVLQPNEHDEMTGVVSHFPHLIASSLVHQAKKWEATHSFLPKLAAGGFRDITRIASSNPQLWQDIFYHNREKMSVLLHDWIEEMSELKELLENNEKEEITSYLLKAKLYRDGLADSDKGAIPAFYDVFVDIQDEPGAIAKVVQLLALEEISIKNIEILEVREGIMGALRLSFYSRKAQEHSAHYLASHGYDTTIQH